MVVTRLLLLSTLGRWQSDSRRFRRQCYGPGASQMQRPPDALRCERAPCAKRLEGEGARPQALSLLLPNQRQPAAHVLGGSAVLPAGAFHRDVVAVNDGERRFVHVLVLLRVEVAATGESEDDLAGRRLRVGLHAGL